MANEFTYKGLQFHLNDNRKGISKANKSMFPKYSLLCNFDGTWQNVAYVDSKQQARAYVKANYWLFY